MPPPDANKASVILQYYKPDTVCLLEGSRTRDWGWLEGVCDEGWAAAPGGGRGDGTGEDEEMDDVVYDREWEFEKIDLIGICHLCALVSHGFARILTSDLRHSRYSKQMSQTSCGSPKQTGLEFERVTQVLRH